MDQTGFWWILLAGAVYGIIHSLTASLKAKELAFRLFGEPGRRFYRLGYVLLSLITTPLYLVLIVLLPDERLYSVTPLWIYATLIIQVAAGILLLASFKGTGLIPFLGLDGFSKLNKSTRPNTLVTTGFYQYSRHPIYFFSLVILWLIPIMTWNILSFAIGITAYTLIGSLFEERKLTLEFGQEYINYRKRTSWIIPIKLK